MAGNGSKFTRTELTFYSKGSKCGAWLYRPDAVSFPPVVIMANGFGAEKSILLPAFAERFALSGLACFVFDYRNFGDSEGEPRKLIAPGRHLEDWRSAVEFVRTLPDVDTAKIGLWGTSFSAGHVIVTAANMKGISAIVAQVPFVDGIATAMGLPVKVQLQGLYHGLLDAIVALVSLGKRRHRVPILSRPDTFGLINTPGSYKQCTRILPPAWLEEKAASLNQAPAFIALTLPFYRPVSYAGRVECPALVVCAEKDNLIPEAAVKATASKMKNAVCMSLPVSHFDVYALFDQHEANETFEKVVRVEAEFLVRHLYAGRERP